MFNINAAGLDICINNKYGFVYEQCRDYITESAKYDIFVEATEEDIETERNLNPDSVSDGYLESVCIYRHIAEKLPEHDSFVFHCAAIEFEGKAYCFTAKSGTGKTTHMKYWRRRFGEGVHVINGDKPIFRYNDGKFYVYGTPWNGKENLGENTVFPLQSIAILRRSAENEISEAAKEFAVRTLISQIYMPKDPLGRIKTLELIGKLADSVKIFDLGCNMSEQAAEIAYENMSKEVRI